jgi:hypothetical protein
VLELDTSDYLVLRRRANTFDDAAELAALEGRRVRITGTALPTVLLVETWEDPAQAMMLTRRAAT